MRNGLILLVILFSSCSQLVKNESMEEKFSQYALYANKAELCICENDLGQAKKYYDTLFDIDIKAHAREKYNYGILSLKLGDTLGAMNLFEELYQKKYSGRYPYIDKFKSTYKQSETSKADETLFEESKEILRTDQIANGKKLFDNEEYFRVVMLNVGKIKKILIKLKASNETSYSINTSALFLPILHYFQFKGVKKAMDKKPSFTKKFPIYKHLETETVDDPELEKLLKECMYNGDLGRYTYAHLNSMVGMETGKTVQHQYNSYSMVNCPEKMKDPIIDKLNATRKQLCLENYKDYYKKAVYVSKKLYDGQIFPSLEVGIEASENYSKRREDYRNRENFLICSNYAMTFQFNNDEHAKNAAERHRQTFYKNN